MNDYSKTSPARGSAMNSNDAGDTVARLFSNAHESEVTSNLILEVQMDLHNNNVGHTIGDFNFRKSLLTSQIQKQSLS